jgi:hypothetical protein
LKGQNSLDWKLHYTIGNLLRRRCLKWVHMIHLSIYKTCYGWKKGQESKCQFDSQPLKVKNRTKLCVWTWCVTYCWKVLDEGYNVSLNLVSIRHLHNTLWAFKVVGIPILRILGLPTWESLKKWHLGASLVTNHR